MEVASSGRASPGGSQHRGSLLQAYPSTVQSPPLLGATRGGHLVRGDVAGRRALQGAERRSCPLHRLHIPGRRDGGFRAHVTAHSCRAASQLKHGASLHARNLVGPGHPFRGIAIGPSYSPLGHRRQPEQPLFGLVNNPGRQVHPGGDGVARAPASASLRRQRPHRPHLSCGSMR